MRPNFPMINAATPDTAGVAMLVPAAQAYDPVWAPEPRCGARTRSKTTHGTVMKPVGITGMVQEAPPGSTKSPPGPAHVTADGPKFVYDAGRSTLLTPIAHPIGPVAETAITCGDIAGTTRRSFE